MESDQHQGLMRFRSVPSSYYSNFEDEDDTIIARLMGSNPNDFDDIRANSRHMKMLREAISTPLTNPAMYSMPFSKRPVLNTNSAGNEPERARDDNLNLIRQRSSPSGLFDNMNTEDAGYGILGNFGAVNPGAKEGSSSSARRVKNRMNFSPGPPCPSGTMTHTNSHSPENRMFSEGDNSYLSGFPIGSWEDQSGVFTENFNALKRRRDDDGGAFYNSNPSEDCRAEIEDNGHTPHLSRHMSLPKTSSEMVSVEKYLQFQDSVPCKIRAKRGCATHPRSIAERVRRTRISERMRKLQDLVPNMDKQTSTSDMLDLAVEYIKDLQIQVKLLSEDRPKCSCLNSRNP